MGRPRRLKSEIAAAAGDPEPATRVCGGCWEKLPKDDFARCRVHGRQRYCRRCHAAAMRARRAVRKGLDTERYRTDSEYRKKVRARKLILMRKYRGTIQQRPCERCGNPESQSHHDDYDQPTVVRWLCVKCHGAEHYPEAQPEHRATVARRWAKLAEKYGLAR